MKIGITSPSAPSTFSAERTKQFDDGLATLASLGFDCKLAPHARDNLSYFSASVRDRLADLHQLYADPTIELILAANGGWNSNQLLAGLDWELIAANPKPLAGYSDLSVLLNAIAKHTGKSQLHSPMVTNGFHANDPMTNQSFLNASRKDNQLFLIDQFGYALRPGELEGPLVGGNLVSLSTLLGTPFEPDWQSKILFWEETAEPIKGLDRLLTHFKNAGVWDKIQGMIIGNLDQIDENFGGRTFDTMTMLKDHFKDCSFPIIKTKLFGHHILPNITLPVGGNFKLEAGTVTISV